MLQQASNCVRTVFYSYFKNRGMLQKAHNYDRTVFIGSFKDWGTNQITSKEKKY